MPGGFPGGGWAVLELTGALLLDAETSVIGECPPVASRTCSSTCLFVCFLLALTKYILQKQHTT